MLDNPWVQAIVLGVVQGLTEFLPVSSSGHLVAVPYLFSWTSGGLAFNVALHAGTLVAVLAYFASDLRFLATRVFVPARYDDAQVRLARRAVLLLAIGTVPAAAVGVTLGSTFEEVFQEPLWVAGFFLVTAALLSSAEVLRRRRARRLVTVGGTGDPAEVDDLDPGQDETAITWRSALVIGAAQALALLPGISRSGATIAAGMYSGLSRSAAARFSFLLSIPIIAGAAVAELPAMFSGETEKVFSDGQVVAGMIAAGISGYWAIRYLLRLVQTDDLFGFARYLVLVAALVGVGYLWLGPVSEI